MIPERAPTPTELAEQRMRTGQIEELAKLIDPTAFRIREYMLKSNIAPEAIQENFWVIEKARQRAKQIVAAGFHK